MNTEALAFTTTTDSCKIESRCSSNVPGLMRPCAVYVSKHERIAISEHKGRGRFPHGGEATEVFEFDRATGVAEFMEPVAPPDRLELVRFALAR